MTQNRSKKVTIRGVPYPSGKAAARALGVTPAAITHARRRGTLDEVGKGRGKWLAKPCTIGGIPYASLHEAARDLGVAPVDIAPFLRVCKALQKKKRAENKSAGLEEGAWS